jgi:hypothetical protein
MAIGDSTTLYGSVTIPDGSGADINIAASTGTMEYVNYVAAEVTGATSGVSMWLYSEKPTYPSIRLVEVLSSPYFFQYPCKLYISDINTYHCRLSVQNVSGTTVTLTYLVSKFQVK